jgi:hypothetical protein
MHGLFVSLCESMFVALNYAKDHSLCRVRAVRVVYAHLMVH